MPDAPVTKFTLDLVGGSKGLLINSRNLCKVGGTVTEKIAAQNGATADARPALQTQCGSKARHKRHARRRGSR